MVLDGGCRVAAVVVAAGSGSRMGRGPRKQFRLLGGRPLVNHCLETIAGHPAVDGLVLVLPAADPEDWTPPDGPGRFAGKPLAVVSGGNSRQDSVLRGLEAAAAWAPKLVLVHDGARPLVSPELVRRVISGAESSGAVSPVLEVSETVKAVDGQGRFLRTLDRRPLRLVQTPEGFVFPMILDAARQALAAGFEADDTGSLARLAGREVLAVSGERGNLKITGPEDLALAERLLARDGADVSCRVGSGYDAHRLVPGRPLIIGGVEVPYDRGLDGHTDADVLIHALADAMLGAAALGDLGRHFPESDPCLDGASSVELLRNVAALIEETGLELLNADATVVAQQPKLARYVSRMRDVVAEALGVGATAVSVKATSTEGMGFEGRGEGISATAVVLLRAGGKRNR